MVSDGDDEASHRSRDAAVIGGQRDAGERSGVLSSLQPVAGEPAHSGDTARGARGTVASAVVAVLMSDQVREAQHTEPVWRDRSDFIIAVDVSGYSSAADREQLWAKQLGENRFKLCCIPFFAYNLTLGDVVETAPSGDRKYLISQVVQPSGRYVFRVWFGETSHPRDSIAADLGKLGALLEWSSTNLLAVDARDQQHAQEIAGYLAAAEAEGKLMFETGRTAA